MNHWIEIRAHLSEAPADWSPLADLFDQHGCPGSLQTDQPPTISAYLIDLEGVERRLALLEEALLAYGVESVSRHRVAEEDWAEQWKVHFKPRRIGKRFVIRPTWESVEPQSGDLEIVLDPGQAFGTGDHPTTRMCLELLEAQEVADKAVADVGCGSGILALAAFLLGAKRVCAVDIDELSVEVAKENALLNNVPRQDGVFEFVAGDGFAALYPTGGWDLVLSNIISATLIRLSSTAYDAVAPGGSWIVSGIIQGNWDDVHRAAERSGFQLEQQKTEGEWVAAVFRRSG